MQLGRRAATSSSTSARWLRNFWQLTIDGLAYGSIYALVAVGYTLVYGVLRLINFAHSEVFMVGMFGQYAMLMLLGFHPSGNAYNEGTLATIGVPGHRHDRRHGWSPAASRSGWNGSPTDRCENATRRRWSS